MSTHKTAFLKMLNIYVQYLLPCLHELLRVHMDKGFRELRFWRHQGKEKTFSHLCKMFVKAAWPSTIVGLGNWSNNDPGDIIKGHPVGPVKAFGRCLRRYCIVIYIDEHRSNMLHHVCHLEMVGQQIKIKDKDGEMRPTESYSGRYCKYCKDNNPKVDCCVNRDYNAARNILVLLEQWLFNLPRPLNFQRGVDEKFFIASSLESPSAVSTRGPRPRVLLDARGTTRGTHSSPNHDGFYAPPSTRDAISAPRFTRMR